MSTSNDNFVRESTLLYKRIQIRNLLRATMAAFVQQLKNTAVNVTSLNYGIGAIASVVVFSYIANQSQDASKFSYLLTGVPFFAIWSGLAFRTGWILDTEMGQNTLEFALISKTPMVVVLFGKALAQLAYGLPTGIVAMFALAMMTGHFPAPVNFPLFIVSVCFTLLTLAIVSLVFAPILVLAGGRAGFFNGILPFGVILSGFVFPPESLPVGLRVLSWLLPTSWAMSSVWQSVKGPDSFWAVPVAWMFSLATSAALFVLTIILFRKIEEHIRVTGLLGRY